MLKTCQTTSPMDFMGSSRPNDSSNNIDTGQIVLSRVVVPKTSLMQEPRSVMLDKLELRMEK